MSSQSDQDTILVSYQVENTQPLVTPDYQVSPYVETNNTRSEDMTPQGEDQKTSVNLNQQVPEAENDENIQRIQDTDSKEFEQHTAKVEGKTSHTITITPVPMETPESDHGIVLNRKVESHQVGNVIDYLYFTSNLSDTSLKVVDSEYLKSSQTDPSRVLDNHAIKEIDDKDATDLEKQDEAEKNSHNKLTFIGVLAKLLLIFFYYADIASNYWTAEMMIEYEYYWYFGCLALFLLATWYSNIKFNFRDIANPYKAFFLGIAQLEYIYFQFCYKESDIDPKKRPLIEACNNPLASREFYQILFNNFPMAFVMVHMMFVTNNTSLVIQSSVIITILTACIFLMYIIITHDKSFQKINLKKIYLLLGVGFHASLEMSGLLFIWGFYAALTRPWGAWLFFPFSLILWFIICGMLEGTSRTSIDYMLYSSFSPVASTYKVGFFLRIVQFVFFIIVFIAKRDELADMLQDNTWFWYFIVGWGCAILWLANSLYFYSSLKSTKEKDVLFSAKNTVIKKSRSHNESLSEKLLVDDE